MAQGLGQPWNPLDDRMATTEDRQQDLLQHLFLADDDVSNFLADPIGDLPDCLSGCDGIFLMEW